MKCAGCGCSGRAIGPKMPWENGLELTNRELDNDDGQPLLIELEGLNYCFPCHCKVTSICFQCWTEVETLYKDKRCKNDPYVCENCLQNEMTNHMWVCYGDGCMTPGEVAQGEFLLLEDEYGY